MTGNNFLPSATESFLAMRTRPSKSLVLHRPVSALCRGNLCWKDLVVTTVQSDATENQIFVALFPLHLPDDEASSYRTPLLRTP
jgi:hypothetical protein